MRPGQHKNYPCAVVKMYTHGYQLWCIVIREFRFTWGAMLIGLPEDTLLVNANLLTSSTGLSHDFTNIFLFTVIYPGKASNFEQMKQICLMTLWYNIYIKQTFCLLEKLNILTIETHILDNIIPVPYNKKTVPDVYVKFICFFHFSACSL